LQHTPRPTGLRESTSKGTGGLKRGRKGIECDGRGRGQSRREGRKGGREAKYL